MPSNTVTVREFLAAILGAYAKGKLLTSTTVREMAAQFGLGQSDPDKIANLLDLARTAIETRDGAEVTRRMDAVSVLAVAQFDIAAAPYDIVQTLLERPEHLGIDVADLTEEQLRPLVEGVVPFAVFRSLIKIHKVPFSPKLSTGGFGAFATLAIGPLLRNGPNWHEPVVYSAP